MELGELVYSLIASPVSENGQTIGAVIIIVDITESAGREKLRREFTANVSHELKTPLTSISGIRRNNGGRRNSAGDSPRISQSRYTTRHKDL